MLKHLQEHRPRRRRLEQHLRRIDDFEGPGYRRVEVEVTYDDGSTGTAWLYEADPEA